MHAMMAEAPLDLAQLDQVIKRTVEAIERGREQIYAIAESAREEYQSVASELESVKRETAEIIMAVDGLEKQERAARVRLMEVSRNFSRYGEEDIKEAYEQAQQLQGRLILSREREAQLRRKRDELERRLRNLETTVRRAEDLVSQVGVVLGYLGGNLQNLMTQIENVQVRQALGVAVIRAQEEERRRVAREIHDGPAQLMANIVLRLEVTERLLATDLDRARKELAELREMVRSSLHDVRKIIFDLRPMALDDLGLVPAIRAYLAEYKSRYGVDVELGTLGQERRLDQAVEVALFRFTQEALSNAARHSGAGSIAVRLEFSPERVQVSVRDDGRGFDPEAVVANPEARYGLVGMRERAEMLGGSMGITTAPGKGTRVTMSVPLRGRGGKSGGRKD